MDNNTIAPLKAAPFVYGLFATEYNVSNDPPAACKTSLEGDEKKLCQTYTEWSQYTASICGSLGVAANISYKFLSKNHPKIATAVVNSIHTVYDATAGANQQFLAAIVDLNEGKSYEPIPQPEPVPPFPDPEGDSADTIKNSIESMWAALKPWIEKYIAKLDKGSPWIPALEGIVTSSDQLIKDLEKLFKDLEK